MNRIAYGLMMLAAAAGCSGPAIRSDGSGATGGSGGSISSGGGGVGATGLGVEAGAGTGGEAIQDASDSRDAGETGDGSQLVEPICVLGGDPTRLYCDLVIQGAGLDQFEGILLDVQTGSPPFQRLGSGQARVVDGKFTITVPQVQERDIIYKITTVHFDADGDGSCGPGDQVFVSNAVLCTNPEQDGPAVIVVGTQTPSSFFAASPTPYCQRGGVCQPTDRGL